MDKENEKILQRLETLSSLLKEQELRINQLELVNEELTLLNKQLLDEKEQEDCLQFAWAGNLGHWYWNVKTNTVTFNPLKITTLGFEKNEVPNNVNYQFFTERLHPDDYSNTMNAMMQHMKGNSPVYEVEYRIRTKSGSYKWYYDRGKITMWDTDGKPLFLAGIVFDITERKAIESELIYRNEILSCLSFTDGLTSLYNHRFLMEKLEESYNLWRNKKQLFSIALFDIDDFKKVNDTYGHIYGDKVLQDVAGILKENVRETDFAGRYGGEEFLVIFPNTDLKSAKNVAERIRQAIENFEFPEKNQITVSGGIKEYNGTLIKNFIHEVDINLYQAKKSGKNCIYSE